MRGMLWIGAGCLTLLFGAAGCSDNASATAKCKGSTVTRHECNACCKRNGAIASRWWGSCGCNGNR